MIKLFWVLLICLGPALAHAQSYPALFEVQDVAHDDVLNIRTTPSASASIVGTLAPSQRNIEVVQLNETGNWGRVNSGESSGWVSMRYLHLAVQHPWHSPQQPKTCYGTEPFWSLDLAGDIIFSGPDQDDIVYTLKNWAASANHTGHFGFEAGDGFSVLSPPSSTRQLNGVLHAANCSDGMSDRTFGISIDILIKDGQSLSMISGCCSLAP